MSSNISLVVRIMDEFAKNTGLSNSSTTPRRYLWTDAFAVCNFLGLQKQTQNEHFGRLALELVDKVHNILGKHRTDDDRKGWISGLSETEGELHPTVGGLRIGKKLRERQPNDHYDDDMEWDRDGQYFHYITKWMHALHCVTKFTNDEKFNILAAEMVKGVHCKFTYTSGAGDRRMHWKMSVDLSRPQVHSMGHHDPLDGYITYRQVHQTLSSENQKTLPLDEHIEDMKSICEGKDWKTTDPLGLGGLLCDAYRIYSMNNNDHYFPLVLLANILNACEQGLDDFIHSRYQNQLRKPAEHRLAFRELGLSIGLQAIQKLHQNLSESERLVQQPTELSISVEKLLKYLPVANEINNFWCNPANQNARSWKSHVDINMVMLATSLFPDGFLCI